MLAAIVLAALLSGQAASASAPPKSAVAQCFESMDGAVYHGDPSDRHAMRVDVATCAKGLAQMSALRALTPAQGPQKLFILGRLLDRSATLSFMGLDDSATALREVRLANLYFRVASGLPTQNVAYHEAALANVELTRIQLQTLRAETALARRRVEDSTLTAYHKL